VVRKLRRLDDGEETPLPTWDATVFLFVSVSRRKLCSARYLAVMLSQTFDGIVRISVIGFVISVVHQNVTPVRAGYGAVHRRG